MVVSAIVFTVLTYIAIANGADNENGGELVNNLNILSALYIGYLVGNWLSPYDWCCQVEDAPTQVCEEPRGSIVKNLGCNEYEYIIWGTSTYSATIWNNNNTDPATATTPVPRIQISVPNPGAVSDIVADVGCLEDGMNGMFFLHINDLVFDSGDNTFPLQWHTDPPSSYTYDEDEEDYFDNAFSVGLAAPSSGTSFEYTWTINSPHQIISGGGIDENWAEIYVTTSAIDVTISCLAVHTCSNTSDDISATIQIQ